MCGFFYFCSWEKLKEDPLIKVKSEIKKALIERGGENYNETLKFEKSKYLFTAHALLPIFGDLETKYPIESKDSSLLFNGQIYSIKNKIIKDSNYKNDGFALKDYLDLDGKNCLNSILNIPIELSGQFSFVYSNENSKIILLARDLAGQKPIYFLKTNKILIVSSILEILGLFTANNKDKKDSSKLYSLPHKFSNIEKIPPGGVVKFDLDNGRLLFSESIYSYFPLFIQSDLFVKKEVALRKKFLISINEIIPENKNFVLCLSGGYDSTNIAMGIKLLGYKPTHVFTVQNEKNNNDVKVAQNICEQFNWPHTVIKPLITINKVNYSSIPNDPATLAIASIAKSASSYSNVILCGDGGDEISRRYRRFLYYKFPLNFLKLISSLKFLSLIDVFSRKKSKKRIEMLSKIAINLGSDHLGNYKIYENNFEYLDSALIYELIYNLPERLLSKTDIVAYSYGVEFRSPFLSPRLYSLGVELNSKKQKYNISKELAKILGNKFPIKNKKLGLA